MKKSKNYRQGFYRPKFPDKYKGNINNIVYRSNYELVAFRFFDHNPNVLEWASEENIIPYQNPLTGRISRYFVDIYAKMIDKNGKIQQYLIEIKPSKQTTPPVFNKKKTKNYLFQQAEYVKNQAKWKAATEWCNKKQMNFVILTEKELGL